MNKFIYRFKPYDYVEYSTSVDYRGPKNVSQFIKGVWQIAQTNFDFKESVKDNFIVTYPIPQGGNEDDDTIVSFTSDPFNGGNADLVVSFMTSYANGYHPTFQIISKYKTTNISSWLLGGDVIFPKDVVINIAKLKHGNICFWIENTPVFFANIYTKNNDVLEDSFTKEILFNSPDNLKVTAPFKDINGEYTEKVIYTILPHNEIKTDVSIGRKDFRGYNLTKGSHNYVIYPYYKQDMSYLDLFYYDGGNGYIADKEIVYMDDRVFLCPSGQSNFLLELSVEDGE